MRKRGGGEPWRASPTEMRAVLHKVIGPAARALRPDPFRRYDNDKWELGGQPRQQIGWGRKAGGATTRVRGIL